MKDCIQFLLRQISLRIGTTGVLCAAACSMALADTDTAEADTLGGWKLSETVVTGERINRHNLTPASVSVFSGDDLRGSEITTVSQLSAVMPNLFIPEYGSRQTRPVSIRGIMSKVKGTAVGYYVDGMPRFELSSFDTDMLDVKSIEVFRGPQSTLYGRNTLGGVINVHTLSPFEYQGTKVRMGYGNHGGVNLQASNHTRVNDYVGTEVGAYFQHTDGFFRNECLNRMADKSNTAGGRIGLHWRPAPGWMLRLTSSLDHVHQGGYAYAPYDTENKQVAHVSYNRPCGYDRLLSNTGLKVNRRTERLSINSQTTYEYIEDDQRVDQDFTAADLYDVTSRIHNSVVSQEFTLKSETDGRLQWVAGAFGCAQWYRQRQGTDYIAQGKQQVAHYETPMQNAAAYGQLSYNIVGGLSATAGLRYDYEHSSQHYNRMQTLHADGTQSQLADFKASMHSNELIPKFALQYKMNEAGMLFATVARGFKAGGFNSSFQEESERTYKPEHNWNYEVGMKLQNRKRTLGGDLTLFYIDWRQQHVNRTVTGLGNIICNAGHSDSKGLELNMMARPFEGLMLQASYGYTYARFLNYRKSDAIDYSGKMTPMVPRNTFAAIAGYTIQTRGWLDRITMNANVTGIGRMYWLEDNEVEQPFYALLGAKVGVKKGPVTLELWGKNLTGTKYLSYYFVSSGKYAQEGMPTTFGATVNVEI